MKKRTKEISLFHDQDAATESYVSTEAPKKIIDKLLTPVFSVEYYPQDSHCRCFGLPMFCFSCVLFCRCIYIYICMYERLCIQLRSGDNCGIITIVMDKGYRRRR